MHCSISADDNDDVDTVNGDDNDDAAAADDDDDYDAHMIKRRKITLALYIMIYLDLGKGLVPMKLSTRQKKIYIAFHVHYSCQCKAPQLKS